MQKALVVEDDKFLARAYADKLNKAGYEVKSAYDGQEAMQLLTQYQPDIILLDLVMPVKDGFSVLKEMQSDEKLKSIPVIVNTNLGQKEDVKRALALGAKDYLLKTDVSINDLVEKIESVLKKKE